MNGNGQVVVAGLFLLTSILVATLAVGLFEVPTYETEAKPIELLDVNESDTQFSPAPAEILLRFTEGVEQGLKPEEIYHGVMGQTLAKSAAIAASQAHSGACSAAY